MKQTVRKRLIVILAVMLCVSVALPVVTAYASGDVVKLSDVKAGQVVDYRISLQNDTKKAVQILFYSKIDETSKLFESGTINVGAFYEIPLVLTDPNTYRVVDIWNWVVKYKTDDKIVLYPITEIPEGTKYARDMYNDTVLHIGDYVTFQDMPYDYRTVNFYDGDKLIDTFVTETPDFIFQLPYTDKVREYFDYYAYNWRVKDIESQKQNNVLNVIAYQDYGFSEIIQARDLYTGATVVSGSVIDFTSLSYCHVYYSYSASTVRSNVVASYYPRNDGICHIVNEDYPVDVFAWKVVSLNEYELYLCPDGDYMKNIQSVYVGDLHGGQIISNGTLLRFDSSIFTRKITYYADSNRTLSYEDKLGEKDIYMTVKTPTKSGFGSDIKAWYVWSADSDGYVTLYAVTGMGGSTGSIGKSGSSVDYTLHERYEEKILYVSGNGAIKDYSAVQYGNFGDTWLDGVRTLYVGEGVTSIGKYAFSNLGFLERVFLPSTLTTIDEGAFRGCGALTTVVIPEGVTALSAKAFEGCDHLETVTVPKSVTSVSSNAFSGCSSLKTVLYGGSIAQFNAITGNSYLSGFEVYFDGDESVCYLTSARSIGSGTKVTLKSQDRYYFNSVSDAIAVAQANGLSFAVANDLASTTYDVITLTKNVGNVGVDKAVIINLNGCEMDSLSVGTVSSGVLYIANLSEKPARITSKNAVNDSFGSGEKTGKVVFDNIETKGRIGVSNHDFLFSDSCKAVLNTFTVQDKDKAGSVSFNGTTKKTYRFYEQFNKFVAYVTPYDSRVKYPSGCKVVENGEIRYYYEDISKAIAEAKGYELSLDGVFANSSYSSLKSTVATDKITLMKNVSSLGVKGSSNNIGRGQEQDGSFYGIHKGIVIDLNGYSASTMSAGVIPQGQILVLTNNSNNDSAITSNVALDDESALGFADGTIVISNVTVSGEIKVANHIIYAVGNKVSFDKATEMKHQSALYRNGALEKGYVFDQSADKWAGYLVPTDQSATETDYPNGEYNFQDGVLRFFYVDLAKAIDESRAKNVTLSSVIVNNQIANDSYSDKIVLLKNAGSLGVAGGSGNNGYGKYGDGSYYGVHKGIIIDLNGFNATTVAPGLIEKDQVLLITNGSDNPSKITGTALDDESGVGYCTGKVVFNNISTTGNIWIAGHEIYMLGTTSYATSSDKIQGLYKGGSLRVNGEIVVEYMFDKNNSQWACYVVPFGQGKTTSDYPESEMYEEDGVRYFFYKDVNLAIKYAQAGQLSLEDCIDQEGNLKQDIATDRIVLLKKISGYVGSRGANGTGFGKNSNGTYYGINKGVIIDLNGLGFDSVSAGIIPENQVLIITNSSPIPCVSLADVTMDDEDGNGYCTGSVIFDKIYAKGKFYVAQHNVVFTNCNVSSASFADLFGPAKVTVNGEVKYTGDGRKYSEEQGDIYSQDLGPNDFPTIDDYIDYLIEKQRRERDKRYGKYGYVGTQMSVGDVVLVVVLTAIAVAAAVTAIFIANNRKKKAGSLPQKVDDDKKGDDEKADE